MGNSTRQFSNLADRGRRFGLDAHDPARAATSATRRRSSRLRVALALFALHVVGAPLLLGGVYAWGMVATAASALVCLLASALASKDLKARVPAVIWVSLLLLAWTALQAAPLPCAWVRVVAPGAADGAAAARALLNAPAPAWCALSYDRGATQQEIIKCIALAATLMTAWTLTAASTRRDAFWIVATSALVMSVVALAHAVVRADAVFGVYRPVEARAPLLLAPLLNANNLGGFVALGPALWIALTHRHARADVRWWGRIAAVVTAVTAILSLSRGAIAQVIGTMLFMAGYIQIRARRSPQRARSRRWTPGLVVLGTGAFALALVAYIAGGQVKAELAGGDLSKLELLARAFAFVREHPWIGVGRGAFSTAFLSVAGREVRFGYAENFIAQWAAEWGVPVTALWIGVVAVALARRLRAARSLASIGAATALLGFCAQNLFDLGFELVGVATVATALLGGLLPTEESRTTASAAATGPLSLRWGVGLCLAAGSLGLVLLGPHLQRESVPELEGSLRASLHGDQRGEFRETLARAVSLHPGEPSFPILAAAEALKHDDAQAPRWLNRAMQLAPHWAVPHVLAFQWLWRRDLRAQALLELRLAAEQDPSINLLTPPFCMLAGRHPESALAAIPRGQHRRAVFEIAGNCAARDTRSSEVIDRGILREFPESPAALERSAYRAAQGGDIESALEILAKLLERTPDWDSARLTRAVVLQRAERFDELARQVTRDLAALGSAPRPELRRQLLSAQADAFARTNDLDGMRGSLDAFRRLAGSSAPALAETYALEGSLQLRLENFGEALSAFHEAYRINNETRYLTSVASTARQLGNRSQELWAYMQLCEREPVGTTYCADRDRLLAPPAPL